METFSYFASPIYREERPDWVDKTIEHKFEGLANSTGEIRELMNEMEEYREEATPFFFYK